MQGTEQSVAAAAKQTAGILLVGHGTREPEGAAALQETARLVARRCSERLVEPCFLELARPTIPEGLARLADAGLRDVTVMPLLLFAAGHFKSDIPRAIVEANQRHPRLRIRIAEHLGCHEQILELSALRYQETGADRSPHPPEDSVLLLVGRGSHDTAAREEMLRWTEMRRQRTPVAHVEACFYAMAEPSLAAALERVARRPERRVVVQPHLLFEGLILASIRERVAAVARLNPGQEWLVTAPLGPSELVAEAIVDRVEQAETAPRPRPQPAETA